MKDSDLNYLKKRLDEWLKMLLDQSENVINAMQKFEERPDVDV